MKAKEIIGEGIGSKLVKGAVGLTGINLLTDPKSDKWSGAGVGRAIAKTGKQIKDFGREMYKGLAGKEVEEPTGQISPAAAPVTPAPAARSVDRSDPAVEPAPPPTPTPTPAIEPAPAPSGESEDTRGRRLGRERLANWPSGQNESVKKKFAVTEKTDEKQDPLTSLQKGIFGQESQYGKAKTKRPNYAGAVGPMQIMPGTFDWMKKKKIIPIDYDIKNPEHNKQAGDALIAHYYNKYQGDPAKVAAAYYAGPGAINKDGTINTHWRDKKNPKAPTVGEYINQTLAKANLLAPATAVAAVAATSKPSAAVDTAKPTDAVSGEKLVQMPDYSMGYKRGDKFIPVTDKGTGAPVDYNQAYNQAQSSMGISPAEALRQSDERLAAHRAAYKQTVQRAPVRAPSEPQSVVPKSPEPTKVAEPALPYAQAYPDQKVAAAQDTGAWDKFINTVTKGRVPQQDKERIQVPESDLNDILRLAGRNK